ncbi:NF-kappa-B-repressing factor [Phymastichus coffea]|uniref:NF-kappa-B-repressing factor n=1 Tax=Phymastichus coffea TaxID=108790 RepID=UPI00273C758A|nr:NF-kappa-B-repressing factor [Phymastichus coffea]
MSIDKSNVDQYKTEHECDEHWELRRKFLLTHAEKFPPDELQCLAQVFTNVEFLGCRYPAETMKIIAELSKDVVQDYREKQKGRLQRTFVGASDAASSKAKGQSRSEKSQSTVNTEESSLTNHPPHYRNFKRKQDSLEQESSVDIKKTKLIDNRKAEIVLFEYLNDAPQSIIARAASSFNLKIEWNYDKVAEGTSCTILMNRNKLSEGVGLNQKEAKREASAVALEKLRKQYYTIKVTKNLTPNFTGNIGMQKASGSNESDAIGNDNIGSKMMKLMGWTGGGLGKKSQGIVEPVSVQQQMTREGLGLKSGFYNMHVFKKKCTEVLQTFARNEDTSTDLVFSPSFSNEERAMIHQIAKQLGLKSQSYGPKSERTLTISRKINPRELVNELIQLGGATDKYQLVEPTEN